jgi:hypothetical protein
MTTDVLVHPAHVSIGTPIDVNVHILSPVLHKRESVSRIHCSTNEKKGFIVMVK